MSISSIINKPMDKLFNAAANSKFMKKSLEQGVSDPARFAAAMLVTSIVSKDAIGCVLYTSQSLNNKKIPEEKRKFVAAVDLMNGIVMVGGQFLIGKVIDAKFTPWLKSKFTGTIVDASKKETLVNSKALLSSDNITKLVKEAAKGKNIDIAKATAEVSKKCKVPFMNGLGILVTALATTALTKRTAAPLISTPMASWLTDTVDKKSKKKQETQMTPAMVDSTMPKVADDKHKLNVVSKA